MRSFLPWRLVPFSRRTAIILANWNCLAVASPGARSESFFLVFAGFCRVQFHWIFVQPVLGWRERSSTQRDGAPGVKVARESQGKLLAFRSCIVFFSASLAWICCLFPTHALPLSSLSYIHVSPTQLRPFHVAYLQSNYLSSENINGNRNQSEMPPGETGQRFKTADCLCSQSINSKP